MRPGPTHILLVEDELADALMVEEALAGQGSPRWAELVHVRSLDDVEAALAGGPVDCVLLDLGLPGCRGLDALHIVLERWPGLPVVVLTGRDAEEVAVAAVAAGAQDYLTKGELTARGLRRAIRYTGERHRMQSQLADANRELRDLNARLRQFARVVAHDLKNPLSAIGGFTELLERAAAGRPSRETEMLAAIGRAVEQADVLIDDLLAYSQAGELPSQPLELDKSVAQAVTALHDLLDRVDARVEVPAPLPVVAGHPVAFHHVLRNLLANAATYRSPERAPVITITAETVNGDCWRIAVTDNGIGVPPDKREAIFEPGVRLAPDHSQGSGFGLAAVRTLVERHGGRVTVDDNPAGPGARFLIELPAPSDR